MTAGFAATPQPQPRPGKGTGRGFSNASNANRPVLCVEATAARGVGKECVGVGNRCELMSLDVSDVVRVPRTTRGKTPLSAGEQQK